MRNMIKIDKAGKVFNIVLGVTYVPLSLFSWLLQMASESAIDATKPLRIALIDAFCIVSFLIPFLCVGGIAGSVILRKKGHSISSFVVQFMPLVIFLLNLILLWLAETL